MSEREAFEEALRKNRYDQVTRWVMADWLEERGLDDEAALQRAWTPERQAAEDFLRDLAARGGQTCLDYGYDEPCERWRDITYEDVLQAGHDWVDRGEWFTQVGQEGLRDRMCDEESIRAYWEAWSLLTGRPLPGVERGDDYDGKEYLPQPFSCTC